jgi:AraC-like DNA-binding protein
MSKTKPDIIPLKEKIGRSHDWKISRMKEVVKPTVPHRHAGYHELIFLEAGSGWHTIGTAELEVIPPVVHCLKSGQVHCWDFCKIPKGFVLMFREISLAKLPEQASMFFDLPDQLSLAGTPIVFEILELLHKEYTSDSLTESGFLAYLNVILHKLAQVAADARPCALPNNTDLQLVNHFRKLVSTHFMEWQRVSQYAEVLHLSPKKLSALTTRVLGKNASEIIKEQIIIESKNRLAHTGLSIAEISFQLQFTDPSYFIKAFRKYTGLTPGQYRELL